ncbi:AAA family ATPase [Pelagibacterium sp. H642]|uniref:AAA family ATPase n=1 Tax=Pelagibacterium sp. H642 TaxID=1881069 RepID=UPI0028165FF1|nr:AAA family ATPase [Pelagibacterium sp. H642]WMT90127.1 AAA family ATPase [Pelagibacterium sp. H642]
MAEHDWSAIIQPVAESFWGEPNKKLSTAKELKWGSQGSRKVDLEDGTWFNHEEGVGGGVVDLVRIEAGLGDDKSEVMAWLEREGFISPSEKPQVRRERQSGPQSQPEPEQSPANSAEDDGGVLKWVKGYTYHDADGNALYQVLRGQWELPGGGYRLAKDGQVAKTFRQRRKDERGNVVWNLDGIGHTIYRHQQVELAIEAGKTILLPEGEKDADTAVELGFEASTNSGGAKNWTPELAALFRDADVVILVDNDEVGIEAGEAKAKSLKGIARRIRILNFADHVPNFPAKHDLTNWVEAGGTADELQRIIDSLPDWKPKPPKSRLGAVTLSNVGREAKKHQWLVQDMIELGGSAAFAGFSQSGKSFLMIELAFCVATGRKFWGRDVMQGLVVYQTGEGDRGFMKRVQGYMLDRGIEDPTTVPMLILPKKINLFVDDKDTDTLIAEAKEWAEHYDQPLRMIVIDTFNKATRGANEISGLDMGKVIDRIERIAEECQCTVMVVDHLSAQGRFRGHGSKTGDLTNVIMVESSDKTDRNGRKIRRMRLDKNKDGENGGSIPFVLRQVVVGFDDLNRPITTCVVDQPDGDDDEQTKTGRLSLNQALVLQTLRDVIAREGEAQPVGVTGCPKGRHVVSWKAFMTELRKKWQYTAPESEPEKRASELNRVVADAGKKLQIAGFIDRDNEKGLIWWTGKEDRVFVKPAPEPAPDLPADVKRELAEVGNDEPPF